MTARGRTDSRKSPYQNTSLAVSRQKQTGLERGVLRDAIQQSAETEQYGLCSRPVTVIFPLLAVLKST